MSRLPSPARPIRHRMHGHTVASGAARIKRGDRSGCRRAGCGALMLMAATAAAADGPVAERPLPERGSTLEYSGRLLGVDCRIWTVVEVAADGSSVADCAGHRLETDGAHDGNAVRITDPEGRRLVEFRPYAPGLRFPLEVGARWRQPYIGFTGFNNLIWDGEAQCKVESFEPVSVPAGDFDAFRIACVEKWMVGPKTGATHVTRWYAPAAGAVVRQVHREDPARWNFELLRIGSAAAAAPPATAPTMKIEAIPGAGPRPQYDPASPGILDPDEY